jgi:hypothetical protein
LAGTDDDGVLLAVAAGPAPYRGGAGGEAAAWVPLEVGLAVRVANRRALLGAGLAVVLGAGVIAAVDRWRPHGMVLEGVVDVAPGSSALCVLLRDGSVLCRGNNEQGAVGDGTTRPRPFFVPVPGVAGAVHLAAGDHFACALDRGGMVTCWGSLGAPDHRPRRVEGLDGVVKIAASWERACAVTRDGRVACLTAHGRDPFSGPQPPELSWIDLGHGPALDVTTSAFEPCIRYASGLECAPPLERGHHGVGPCRDEWKHGDDEPPPVPGTLTGGVEEVCEAKPDGEIWCRTFSWGKGHRFCGKVYVLSAPVPLRQVAPFLRDTCAVDDDHRLWCEPRHEAGPARVVLRGVDRVVLSYIEDCAVRTDGTAACWDRDRPPWRGGPPEIVLRR